MTARKPSPHTPPTTLLLLLAACQPPASNPVEHETADSSSGTAATDDAPGFDTTSDDRPDTTSDDEPEPPSDPSTDDGDTEDIPITCGNGLADEGEMCDDGTNDGSYGGCLPDCSGFAARCGDGHFDIIGGEGVRGPA